MTGRWAPDNEDGLHAYVVTTSTWGLSYDKIRYAASLADAKRQYGWTRQRYTSVAVRRAKPEDVTP